jgi:hypothetical protein
MLLMFTTKTAESRTKLMDFLFSRRTCRTQLQFTTNTYWLFLFFEVMFFICVRSYLILREAETWDGESSAGM